MYMYFDLTPQSVEAQEVVTIPLVSAHPLSAWKHQKLLLVRLGFCSSFISLEAPKFLLLIMQFGPRFGHLFVQALQSLYCRYLYHLAFGCPTSTLHVM